MILLAQIKRIKLEKQNKKKKNNHMLGLRTRAAPLILHGRLCELAARRFPWLCLVTDTTATEQRRKRFNTSVDREFFYQHIYKCLEGGVDMLHFRDRELLESTASSKKQEFVDVARRLQSMAQRFDVPLILNDNPEAALELGCWVHFESTSNVWTPEKIKSIREEFDKKNLRQCAFGYSVTLENLNDVPFCQAADYYVAEPVFKSIRNDFTEIRKFGEEDIDKNSQQKQQDDLNETSQKEGKSSSKKKSSGGNLLGLEGVEVVMRNASGDPVIAVGGITQENVQQIMGQGCAGCCVVGELMDSKRPTEVGRNLKELMMKSTCGNVPKAKEGRSITEILSARRTMQMGKPGGRTTAAGVEMMKKRV